MLYPAELRAHCVQTSGAPLIRRIESLENCSSASTSAELQHASFAGASDAQERLQPKEERPFIARLDLAD